MVSGGVPESVEENEGKRTKLIPWDFTLIFSPENNNLKVQLKSGCRSLFLCVFPALTALCNARK